MPDTIELDLGLFDSIFGIETATDSDANKRSLAGNLIPATLQDAAFVGAKIGMAIPYTLTSTAGTLPKSEDITADLNHYVHENSQKPPYQQLSARNNTLATWDWHLADGVDAYMGSLITSPSHSFHLVLGHNTYLPAWMIADLVANPGNILDIITHQIDGIFTKYPSDPFYRIDVVNELTSTTTTPPDQGWRASTNAFYDASRDPTTLSGVLGGNSEQWIWDAFTYCHTKFPTAKLAFTDTFVELGAFPVDLGYQYLGNPDTSLYLTDNSTVGRRMQFERILYEAWRMKVAGVPIDNIGMQCHLAMSGPLSLDNFVAMLRNLNGIGLTPSITELTAEVSSSRLPAVPTTTSFRRKQQGVFYAKAVLDVLFRESPCEEVIGWTQFGSPLQMPLFNSAGKTPLYYGLLQSLLNAAAPARRTIKRSRRTEFWRTPFPLWLTLATGSAAISIGALRMRMAASSSYQIDWDWYGHANLTRPITPTNMTMVMAWWQPLAAVADNSILFGHGVGTSGTPNDHFKCEVMANNDVQISLKRGGSTILAAIVVGKAVPSANNCIAVRFDAASGGAISAAMNGGGITLGHPSGGGNITPDTVYIGSNPDGSGTSSAPPELMLFDVHHNPDFPAASDLRTLSIYRSRINDFPPFFVG